MGKLTERQIVNIKPTDKRVPYEDGDGLRLVVFPQGGKYWEKRYTFNGKRGQLSLGSYPTIGLALARNKNQEASLKIAKGINPSVEKRLVKRKLRDSEELTFKDLGESWFNNYKQSVVEDTAKKVRNRLDNDIYPFVGNLPIETITSKHILNCLQFIVDRNAVETAHRVKRIITSILDQAVISDQLIKNPAFQLQKLLPRIKKGHFNSIIDKNKFAGLLRAIDAMNGSSPEVTIGLKLMPLVFVRPHELRSMKWEDIDWKKSEWRFLVTKTGTQHIVPLASQSIKLLTLLHQFTGDNEYAFASNVSTTGYLSDNALLVALRRMGITKEEMTIHGFRATARTLLHEELGIDPYVIEHQLAHKTPTPLGKAYDRTKFLVARKEAMQTWADYLDELKANG